MALSWEVSGQMILHQHIQTDFEIPLFSCASTVHPTSICFITLLSPCSGLMKVCGDSVCPFLLASLLLVATCSAFLLSFQWWHPPILQPLHIHPQYRCTTWEERDKKQLRTSILGVLFRPCLYWPLQWAL